jgi:tRNA-splicing endonuclease subunit Sen54
MGHSAPRSTAGEDGVAKAYKRLELLPEEAIYLIERGALFCWKGTNLALSQIPGLNDVLGSPMSVQQAYSEMIGTEGMSLEKFQVGQVNVSYVFIDSETSRSSPTLNVSDML